MTSPEILHDREKSLEDAFFRQEDTRLIQRLRDLRTVETTREALAKASGLARPEVLDTLMSLGIRAETVAALSLVPLLAMAWADGTLDRNERQAILARAPDAGVTPGSTAHALLEAWLDRQPNPTLLDSWTHLIRGIRSQLGPVEAARLKAGVLEQARAVAGASRGFLGMGAKVSGAEAGVLAQLEAAFAEA
jgi:hypothetical protein